MVADAITVDVAGSTIGTVCARSATVDVGFRAVEHLIVTSRVLTNSIEANVAFAICAGFAQFSGYARRTIGAAAILVRFRPVDSTVHAGRGGAYPSVANLALAIGLGRASEPVWAGAALRSSTIDIRFDAVFDAIGTFGGGTGILIANGARALRVFHAFDTSSHAVAELRSIARSA